MNAVLPEITQFRPRILTTGFDTVHYTAPVEPTAKLIEKLNGLKQAAQENKPAILDIDGEPFTMSPKAGGGLWRWKLQGEPCNILLSDNPKQSVKAKVELGSLALWSQGAAEAIARSRSLLSKLAGVANGWPALASRLDLAVDMQGWEPRPDMRVGVVSRGRARDSHADGKAACPKCTQPVGADYRLCPYCAAELRGVDPAMGPHPPRWRALGALPSGTYFGRQVFRGFSWGSGKPIKVRLYCKTIEIVEKSGKRWFFEIWSSSDGYDPDAPVWRLEVQVRRDLLKNLVRPGGADFGLLSDCIEHASTLFRYLIGGPRRVCTGDERHDVAERHRRCRECGERVRRPTGWVELRVVDDGEPQPTRWPLHPAWQSIQSTYFEASAPAAPAARKKRADAEEQVLLQMLVGVSSTLAAHYPDRVRELERSARADGREPTQDEYLQLCAELAKERAAARGMLDGDDDKPSLSERIATKIAARPSKKRPCPGCGRAAAPTDEYCQACGVIFEEPNE